MIKIVVRDIGEDETALKTEQATDVVMNTLRKKSKNSGIEKIVKNRKVNWSPGPVLSI